MILKAEERPRLRMASDKSPPDYILTNYRLVKDRDDSKYSKDHELFYQMVIGNEVILSVYKRIGT